MLTIQNCPPNPTFLETFERCCDEFDDLSFASAYCSWPRGTLFNHALRKLNSVTAVLGPLQNGACDGFFELAKAMKEEGKKVHVHEFEQNRTFHPKLYVFRRGDRSRALILGSTNFTKRAFYANEELDVLLEGELEGQPQFDMLSKRFIDWFFAGRCLNGKCTLT